MKIPTLNHKSYLISTELMEFFLNGAKLSLKSEISGNRKITEAWIGFNLKILSLHMSWWHCGSILVSHTRGGYVAGSSPFTVMTNIFVTEFSEYSKTFRKNTNVNELLHFVNISFNELNLQNDKVEDESVVLSFSITSNDNHILPPQSYY